MTTPGIAPFLGGLGLLLILLLLLVYSRGPDGDDDGGRELGTKVEPKSDGDVISLRSRQPAGSGT